MIKQLNKIQSLIESGVIHLGLTRLQVQNILGEPDRVGGSSRKYRALSIYKYGDVEFVFPPARSYEDCKEQTLQYVYVDDGVEGVNEPIFLLK